MFIPFPITFSRCAVRTTKTLMVILASAMLLNFPLHAADGADPAVLGVWEGESKCTVPDSPCHDEHVIYEIRRDEKSGGEKIDAYKVVNGEKQFMDALLCSYNPGKKNLSCSGGNPQKKSAWEYFVEENSIQRKLFLGDEKTLYRKVSLARKN